MFDGAPEPLNDHVVSPCAFAIHTDFDVVRRENVGERTASELGTLVGVEDLLWP